MKPLRKITAVFILFAMISGIISAGFVSADDNQQQATFASPILVANTSFLNIRTGPSAVFSVLTTVVGGTELPVLGVADDRVWYYVATDAGAGWVNIEFTLPRGAFANVPLVDSPGATVLPAAALGQGGAVLPAAPASVPVNTGGLTTVTGFSTDGDFRANPSLSSPKLAGVPGEGKFIFPLLDIVENEDGKWFAIYVPELGRGWTQTGRLRYLECNPADVIAVVNRDVVMNRAVFGQPAFQLRAGDEGLVTGRRGDDVTIRLQSSEEGSVPADTLSSRADDIISVCDFAAAGLTPGAANLGQGGAVLPGTTLNTTPPVPALAGNRVVVNTGNLNIRTGPGAQFSVVTTVPGGTELAVIGRANDGVWYLTQGNYGQGWVNSQFTIFRGNYSSIPILAEAYSAPMIVQNGSTGFVAPAALGQGGAVLPVNVPVNTGGATSVTGFSTDGDFRSTPSLSSPKLAGIPGEGKIIFPLLDIVENEDGKWFAVYVPELGNGWTQTGRLRYLECSPSDVIAVVTRDVVMNRAAFGQPAFQLRAGDEGLVTGRRGDDVTIRLQSTEEGTVPADVLTSRDDDIISICDFTVPGTVAAGSGGGVLPGTAATVNQPALSGNRVVINTGNLNVRSGPAATFSVVATVPGGTELAVTGRANDGVWYRVQGNFGVGWVNNQFTIFRGNYSSIPIVNAGASG